MTNKIGITVEANVEKATQDIQAFATITKKALDPKEINNLEDVWAKLTVQKKLARDELSRLQRAYKEWAVWIKQVEEAQRKYNELSKATTKAWAEVTNYRNTWDKELSAFRHTIEKNTSVWWKLKWSISKLWPVIAAAFSIRAIFWFSKELDNARSEIVKATWASGDLLKSLQSSAQNVFRQVPESIDVVWKAIGEVNTRFWATGETLNLLTNDFLDFARITWQDVNTAVAWVSRLMQDVWLDIENTSNLLDILVTASQITSVDLWRLTTTATNFGVQFRNIWFSLEETIALLAKFEAEWVSTEKITSWLTQALNNLARQGFSDLAEWFNQYKNSILEAKTQTEAITIATEIFWARAAADMAIAIREWRFEIDELSLALENADWRLSETAKEALTLEQRASILWNQLKSELIPILESILPVFESIVDFVPKIVWGWKLIFIAWKGLLTWIAWELSILWNNISRNFNNFSTRISWFWNQVWTIFSNLVSNIWVAFWNIWPLIWKWLNKALDPINSFFNTFTSAYNKTIWKLLWPIEWGVNLSVDFWETKQMKSILDWVKEISAEVEAQLEKNNSEIDAKNKILNKAIELNAKATRDSILAVYDDVNTGAEKRNSQRLNAEKQAVNEALWLSEQETKGKWGQAKKQEQIQEDLLKKTQEYLQKETLARIESVKNSNATEEEKAKEIIRINEQLEASLKQLTETAQQREKRLAQETLKREEEKARKIWEYNKDAEKLIDSLTKTTENYTKEVEKVWQAFEKLKDDASRNIKDINNELSQLEFDTDVKLAERRLQLLEEEKRLAQEMQDWASIDQLERQKKIKEELLLIDQNANAEILKWVEARSKLSDAERILDDARIQREVLEERKAINEAIANDEEINLEDIQNLKNRAYAEDLIEKRESLNAQLEVAKNNYETELALIKESDLAKRQIESQYTEFLKQQVDSRIADYRRLQAAAESASSLLSGWGGGNQTSVSQNINVSNSIDAESFLRELSKTFK